MAIGTGAAILGSSLIAGASGAASSRSAARAAERANDATVAESRRQFDLVRSDTAPIRALGNSAVDLLSQMYFGRPVLPAPGQPPAQDNGIIVPSGVGADSLSGSDIARIAFGRVLGGSSGSRAPVTIDNSTQQPVSTTPTGMDWSAFFRSPEYLFNVAEGQNAIDRSAASRHGLLSGAAVREGQRYASGLATRESSAFIDRLMQQAGLGSTGIGASAAAGANSASTIGASNANAAAQRGSAYMQGGAAINNAVQGGLQNWMLTRYLGAGNGAGGTMVAAGY